MLRTMIVIILYFVMAQSILKYDITAWGCLRMVANN